MLFYPCMAHGRVSIISPNDGLHVIKVNMAACARLLLTKFTALSLNYSLNRETGTENQILPPGLDKLTLFD